MEPDKTFGKVRKPETATVDKNAPAKLSWTKYFGDLFKDFLDLDKGVDKWATINEVKSKQSMSGANAWMLMCSIAIASIGLNLNSQAVIIGAMLISPLMSPILGIGMGVAINDREALKHALLHFGAAILIAIVSSTIYFFLTPLDAFTTEIESRTHPTFLDIFIAIFGGIAGIVSIARKDISTTLPGVAIATALMPPLCVAGYGLANASFYIASKAFYLFFLNSFFVALATYVIVRQMHFPYKKYASPKERRKNRIFTVLFSILMIIPSVLIFRTVYAEFDENKKIDQFIAQSLGENEKYLDDHELYTNDLGEKTLLLKVYGSVINKSNTDLYQKKLEDIGLKDVAIEIIPTTEINLQKIKQLETQLSNVDDKITTQINELIEEGEAKEKILKEVTNDKNFYNQDASKFDEICEELKIFFPAIEEIGIAISQVNNFDTTKTNIPTAFIQWKNPKPSDKLKLKEYLETSYNLKDIKIIYTD